jgi:vacuolar-type H+-ATPase subunit I/STV1
MSWQTQTPADRFFGSITYLLPIVEVYSFGKFVFEQFPIAELLYQPLAPLMWVVYALPMGSFALFLGLYLGVVNNRSISRFIRFNVLQAILIGILLSLCSLALRYLLLPIIGGSIVTQVLMNIIFLGTIGTSVYAIVMSALGKYAEFAQLSEAAHIQIDRYF